jgi:phosphoenolpyruvate synthase/pyruvate phosphate dikinase
VEGTARIITDHAKAYELAEGEILVCELTDPGWTPYFEIAAAVVIDIGGPLSHGAIVARELGVPCVINTGNGTRRIPAGARVRVDGGTGTVNLLP